MSCHSGGMKRLILGDGVDVGDGIADGIAVGSEVGTAVTDGNVVANGIAVGVVISDGTISSAEELGLTSTSNVL